MLAGALNKRVQLQTQTTVQDVFGQPLQEWATVYTFWASIDIQHTQLLNKPEEFVSKTLFRIETRWTSSVLFYPNQRLVFTESSNGLVHTYNIETVTNDRQNNSRLIIMCYELGGKE